MPSPPESDRERRLRQQAELAGSLAPRGVLRALRPSKPPKPRLWKEMRRAEKYALLQSQILMWALIAAVGYLIATRVSVLLTVAFLAPYLVLYGWLIRRIVRQERQARQAPSQSDEV